MKLLGTIEFNEDLVNKKYVDDAIIENAEVFVAVYEQTTYADVIAAIDANKVIMLDMPANHNLFNITHATYTNGGNAIMYAIFKMNNRSTLMTATLTPQNQWTVTHTDLQEKLVSGTNIKTINNESLLGAGNIDIQGGGGGDDVYVVTPDTTSKTLHDVLYNKKVLLYKINDGKYRPVLGFYDLYDTRTKNVYLTINLNFQVGVGNVYQVIEFKETGASGGPVEYKVQDKLVSGTNIKTINNQSLLGSGNINIQGGGTVDTAMSDTSENAVQNKVIKSYVDAADTNLQTQLDTLTGRVGQNFEVGKEKWYGTYTDENGETFQVYSKVVYIPALPATAGITTYSHGVSNIKQILSIYGFTTDGFVLNAPRQVVADNITIYQASKSASNQTFSIEVGKDRSSKKAYVVMIYAKNN